MIKKARQCHKFKSFPSALNSGSGAVLLLLDLSATFHTIDHGILLSRLNSLYGISGDALD